MLDWKPETLILNEFQNIFSFSFKQNRDKKVWVVLNIDINYQNFDINDIKLKDKHFLQVVISLLSPRCVSLIIGSAFPELQIHFDCRLGEPHAYAGKTKLGWVLLGG